VGHVWTFSAAGVAGWLLCATDAAASGHGKLAGRVAAFAHEHRALFAVLSVGALMAAGALLGLVSEAVLGRLGLGTGRVERVE